MTAALAVAPTTPRGGSPVRPAAGPALLAAIVAVNLLGFVVPVLNLLRLSFLKVEATGTLRETFDLSSWQAILTDGFYAGLLVDSVRTCALITGLTLVLSYPIALLIHRCRGTIRTLLLVLVVTPLLTSAVVRTYGWVALLYDQGLVNGMLMALGLSAPLRLMFNTVGVVIGLTEILMPYMILSLLAGFGRLDPRYEEAAMTLGASPWRTFLRVVLPLTLPGIALGCLLTFVLALSSFITPKLLGGGRVFLLATEIYDQAMVTLNWPLAAALSMVILAMFGLALVLYGRLVRRIG
ncbi:ABC transporter permease [Methylobacterium indicum]|uniref:Polyamine ABC transporter permease n=1 Tax=Methylobacterium indicum TaxID=1775910 RepID=A0A0J6RHV7_9HYPH|nr:ABC transporter permease [Methylobacterium indicum]KMO20889.1 polyamine ABC transporter permease [Methylobacterium indicum]KMO21112.1 polyamine ABC transporter permease [Methylobacterium indicum]BCM86747.1 polyamine ABC transporter permease [Methylobacterium indicum]